MEQIKLRESVDDDTAERSSLSSPIVKPKKRVGFGEDVVKGSDAFKPKKDIHVAHADDTIEALSENAIIREPTRKLTRHQTMTHKQQLKARQRLSVGLGVADVDHKEIKQSKWLIDPRVSPAVVPWDGIVVVALIFTAIVTPFEVCFLGPPEEFLDAIFLVNRVVDLIFIGDVCLQFFLIQAVSDNQGDRWITDHRALVRMYLKGWFTIDFISIAVSVLDIISVSRQDTDYNRIKLLRVIRGLRLIKLVRLLRTSRLVKRWESKIRINYAALSLMRILISLLLCTHWQACIWTLGSSFTKDTPKHTWMGVSGYCVNVSEPETHTYGPSYYTEDAPQGPDTGYMCMSPTAIYAAATYWSAMTITSIGYGDISATPGNSWEQAGATVLMLTGAMLWGQVVAIFCSVMGSLQATSMRFRETLDHLNDFMASEQIPNHLQWRLREFFFRTKHLRVAADNTELLQLMSPGLQAETLKLTSARWLRNVHFLHGTEGEYIAALILALKPLLFTPDDRILPTRAELFVLHRGVALHGGKILQAGCVWGEDALLECEALRSRNHVKALTYLETNSVHRVQILRIAEGFPDSYARLRRFIGFMALHRQIVLMARIERTMRKEMGLGNQRTSALVDFFRRDTESPHKPKLEQHAARIRDSNSTVAKTLGESSLSFSKMKRIGRTHTMAGYYAVAAGFSPEEAAQAIAACDDGVGELPLGHSFRSSSSPSRSSGPSPHPRQLLRQRSLDSDDDKAPRSEATVSSCSARMRLSSAPHAAQSSDEVVIASASTGEEQRSSLASRVSEVEGAAGLAHPPRATRHRHHHRTNKLASDSGALEQLRAELRSGLREQAGLIERLSTDMRAHMTTTQTSEASNGQEDQEEELDA